MTTQRKQMEEYLAYCSRQKRLDAKTIKAYGIDLKQFAAYCDGSDSTHICPSLLEGYIAGLHQKYKPKTVRRKIASLRAFFHYLEYRDLLPSNPFNKVQVRFREPVILPRTLSLRTIETLLSTIYARIDHAPTEYQRKNALRDAAVVELLFATGMRISELCSLRESAVNLLEGTILIYGKGNKERRLQIGNRDVIDILRKYHSEFYPQIVACRHFFAGQSGHALSDQAVRRMLHKYTSLAAIEMHITPHMFRHTFATCLLEADVDIRYIQEMLGHSSIHITEIYTHVALSKQRDILTAKHPRNQLTIDGQA